MSTFEILKQQILHNLCSKQDVVSNMKVVLIFATPAIVAQFCVPPSWKVCYPTQQFCALLKFPCVSRKFFVGTTKAHREMLISLAVSCTHLKITISLSVFIELTGKYYIPCRFMCNSQENCAI